jgi:hypothetical protein
MRKLRKQERFIIEKLANPKRSITNHQIDMEMDLMMMSLGDAQTQDCKSRMRHQR